MNPAERERWRQVRGILREALDLPPGERLTFVANASRGDPDLGREVEQLLAADESAGQFLESAASEYAAGLLEDSGPSTRPVEQGRVAAYVIDGLIGHGGMGSVYLAHRDDGQFDQQVALKVIPRDRNTEDIARRFLAERQILADLVHPNIARLLDGGVTDDGRPYFAMEYVEGEPLTTWADAHQLDVEGRLRLFEDVCAAVDHAQRQMVVHRDLKPSNILVDGSGAVKLLDFGIAKLVDETGRGEETQDLARLMTPAYAAPEQLRGLPISTATDVYSLGAILYELLSGKRPHGAGTLTVVERRLTQPDTKRLSSVVDTASLRRQLRGDVDNIVARAMEIEVERRYPTAGALLEDLRRYRRGQPVSAVAPTVTYRVRKFVGRNRGGVAVAAALLLLASVGVVGMVWQARIAALEAKRATRVKDLLIEVFAASDPAVSGGRDPLASELLQRGAEKISQDLSGDPSLRSEMMGMLGGIREELGQYEAARELHTAALDERERIYPAGHILIAESRVQLAAVAIYQSRAAEAESLLMLALPVVRRERRERPGLASSAASNLASALTDQGRFEEAEPFYHEALDIDRSAFGEHSLEVAHDFSNLAVFQIDQGQLREARGSLERALEIRRGLLPPAHPDLASTVHNLADLERRAGDLAKAEALFQEVIATRRQIYGGAHPRLAGSIRSYGTVLQQAGRADEAEVAFLEAYAMSRELLGDRNETVALALNDLGTIAFVRSDLELSTSRFRESLAIFEQLLPEDHPTVQTLRSNIATIEVRRGNYEAGEVVYREVLRARIAKLGEQHPTVADGIRNVGIALRLRGRAEEAVREHAKALSIYRETYGDEHSDVALTLSRSAQALCDLGRLGPAESQAREAAATFAKIHPDGHRNTADAQVILGRILTESGRVEVALPILEAAVALFVDVRGPDHNDTALARCELALCLHQGGRVGEALVLLEENVARLGAWAPRHPDRTRLEQGALTIQRR